MMVGRHHRVGVRVKMGRQRHHRVGVRVKVGPRGMPGVETRGVARTKSLDDVKCLGKVLPPRHNNLFKVGEGRDA